jgi:chromosome partition protein MukE
VADQAHTTLADVIDDALFPEVDLLLREGRHIDDLDLERFTFLEDGRSWLERFYNRFGCDLVRTVDRYYYLLPRGDRMGRRYLTAAEMLVGQAMCLLRLDPGTLGMSGRTDRIRVVGLLDQLLGADKLGQALNPRRKRRSKAVEEEAIRVEIDAAIRTLARLGFVDDEGELLRLRAPLQRFAEPVGMEPNPEAGLAGLIEVSGTVEAEPEEDDE